MKFQKINIATARIKGLEDPPYYFESKCYYAWDIMFKDTSTLLFANLPCIKVGNTIEESEIFCNELKENFKKGQICQENLCIAQPCDYIFEGVLIKKFNPLLLFE